MALNCINFGLKSFDKDKTCKTSTFQIHRIHNPHNDRDHASVRYVQCLTRAIPFAIDQHRIANARLRVIQRDKVIFRRDAVTIHD